MSAVKHALPSTIISLDRPPSGFDTAALPATTLEGGNEIGGKGAWPRQRRKHLIPTVISSAGHQKQQAKTRQSMS